ncbi:MAG: hypothetical protein ACI4LC_06150 [Emergencia sp.]
MKKRLLRFTVMMAAFMLCFGQAVWAADDDANAADGAGNSFAAGNEVSVEEDVENELFAAGETVKAGNITVGNNVFAAGRDVSLNGARVEGTVFAAGYTVNIDAKAGGNIWAAGSDVVLGKDSSAKAAGAAGRSIRADGEYKVAYFAAEKVYIDGKVSKSLNIEAEEVEFGPNAEVTGVIKVEAKNEPLIADGAKVSEIDYSVSDASDDILADEDTESPVSKAIDVVLSVIGVILAAFIISVFAGSSLEGSKRMVLERPVVMLVSGLLANIVAVIAVIALCFTGFGVRTAVLGAAVFAAVIAGGTAFASASMGRLIFDRIKPGFSPVLASVIGAAAAGLICAVPYIGFLISLACEIYTLGYFVQLGYAEAKKLGGSKAVSKELDILE